MKVWHFIVTMIVVGLLLEGADVLGELRGFEEGLRRGRALGWEEGATAAECAIKAAGDRGDAIRRCVGP